MINTPRKNSKYYNISSSLEILLFLYLPGIQNKIIAKNMQIALFFTISLSDLIIVQLLLRTEHRSDSVLSRQRLFRDG